MPTPASVRHRSGGQDRMCRRAVRIGEPGHRRRGHPALPHGLGQRDEIVLVGVDRQWRGMANQLPAARSSDPARMAQAEVPGVWLTHSGQRTHDGRGVGIDVCQRRHRVMGAPGPTAPTGNIHDREVIAVTYAPTPTRASPECSDVQPLRSLSWPIPAVPGVEAALQEVRGAVARCAVRFSRRPFRAGAAAPNGSIWRCSRPMNPSNGAGNSG